MNAMVQAADLSLVDNEQRGKAIERRRIRMGIKSVRQFAEQLDMDRGAVTRAERGEGSDQTYARIETWLDDREEEMSSDAEEAAGNGAAEVAPVVTIKMTGVYGIDDVTVSGPVEHLAELRNLAVELMRDVRERGDNGK